MDPRVKFVYMWMVPHGRIISCEKEYLTICKNVISGSVPMDDVKLWIKIYSIK